MNEQCNSELAFTQTYVLLPRYGTFFTPVSKVGLSWMNTIMYATTHDNLTYMSCPLVNRTLPYS